MTILVLTLLLGLMLPGSTSLAPPNNVTNDQVFYNQSQVDVILKTLNEMHYVVNKTESHVRSLDQKLYHLEKQQFILEKEQDVVESTIKTLQKTVEPRDCTDVYRRGDTSPGVYEIHVAGVGAVSVWCSGGWTTFQRRKIGDLSFDRDLVEYEAGFGEPDEDVWLGLRALHVMTKDWRCSLRAELTLDPRHSITGMKYVEASRFAVGAGPGYRLTATGISGTLPSGAAYLETTHSGMEFTTRDSDRDKTNINCAQHPYIATGSAGGWYNKCWSINVNAGTTYASSPCNKVDAYWNPYTLSGVELKFKC